MGDEPRIEAIRPRSSPHCKTDHRRQEMIIKFPQSKVNWKKRRNWKSESWGQTAGGGSVLPYPFCIATCHLRPATFTLSLQSPATGQCQPHCCKDEARRGSFHAADSPPHAGPSICRTFVSWPRANPPGSREWSTGVRARQRRITEAPAQDTLRQPVE